MGIVESVAIAAGLSWASGLRLYAVLFLAGLLAKFGYITLPPGLAVLTHPFVMTASGVMFSIEFLADKVPGLDSLWDAVHTFIRIPAGALLAAAALGEHDPAIVIAAALLGGTLASGSHFAKAGSRALINTSPEPFSNWTASFSEDALAATGLWAAFAHPILFLIALLIFVVVAIWFLPKLWRTLKALVVRLRHAASA